LHYFDWLANFAQKKISARRDSSSVNTGRKLLGVLLASAVATLKNSKTNKKHPKITEKHAIRELQNTRKSR